MTFIFQKKYDCIAILLFRYKNMIPVMQDKLGRLQFITLNLLRCYVTYTPEGHYWPMITLREKQ